jgi:hypothetical protein
MHASCATSAQGTNHGAWKQNKNKSSKQNRRFRPAIKKGMNMGNSNMLRPVRRVFSTITSNIPATLLALCAAAGSLAAQPANDTREPELPANCADIKVPPGNKVSFHVYAIGVQVYRWDGTAWVFVEPIATLYANADYDGEVGIHYAGPTWESNSGSKVVSQRIGGCTPDANSIPWLLLQTVSTEGPGVFNRVTFIQRVNTVGGLAPATSGLFIGEVREVFYTAEYIFYRASSK